MKIGSHVSMSGEKMLLGSCEEATSYGANAFMVYTGAPQNTKRKPLEDLNIDVAKAYMIENGIEEVVVHAPYIINIANTQNEGTFNLGVEFLKEEIRRAEAIGAKQIVLHPGAHVGAGSEVGIERIIEGLNLVLRENQKVQIALETMAGKGSECGRSFEEIAKIIEGVTLKDKLSVCMDTCHIHDAGYDVVGNFEGVLEEFDRVIGLDRLKVLHLNNSKNPRGAGKDRHANVGASDGYIPKEILRAICQNPVFKDIPIILETPFGQYKEEIAYLKGDDSVSLAETSLK